MQQINYYIVPQASDMTSLLPLLVAFCIVEFFHNSIEIWGMRQKVRWLASSLAEKPHGSWPINIDTKLKTWLLHIGIVLLVGGAAYLLLMALDIGEQQLVLLGVLILALNYTLTTWKVDKFHYEIGQLMRPRNDTDSR